MSSWKKNSNSISQVIWRGNNHSMDSYGKNIQVLS